MEFILTRKQIQDKLRELTVSTQNKEAVKTSIQMWMEENQCSQFEISQILNDLTSYKEYLDLVN